MPVTAPPRDLGRTLQNRQAKPLTGLEIGEAIEKDLIGLSDEILKEKGFLSDRIALLTDTFRQIIKNIINRQPRLQRMNITYPKVGWNAKVRLELYETEMTDGYRFNGEEDSPSEHHFLNGEVELDLERNVRINLQFGESGKGIVIASKEVERIPTGIPDHLRRDLGMPIEAEYQKPDGTTGKVDIRELRAARTVDVGSGAPDRVPKMIPTDVEGHPGLKEVFMTGGQQGELIVTPDQLPPITLDVQMEDLLAVVAEPPKEPIKEPLPPPKTMQRSSRPDVKLKTHK